jgi:hypothetical protein
MKLMVLDLFLFNENADTYIHAYLIIVKNLEWMQGGKFQ